MVLNYSMPDNDGLVRFHDDEHPRPSILTPGGSLVVRPMIELIWDHHGEAYGPSYEAWRYRTSTIAPCETCYLAGSERRYYLGCMNRAHKRLESVRHP